MTEQPGLFDEIEATGPVTAEVILAALSGWPAIDPRTGLPFIDAYDVDGLIEHLVYWDHEAGQSFIVGGFGRFVTLASWGEHKDETPVGYVYRHEDTGKVFMITYTYSSWDSPDDREVVEAEEYTFTETRWRAKR